MKFTSFSYQNMFVLEAYKRLKEWFDPSLEGTPYEVFPAQNPKSGIKKGFLLKKTVFFRF